MPPLELDAFCHTEYGRLVHTMTLYTGDAELARDIAQEAMARLCLHWRKVRAMDQPVGWLHRVAMNTANSYFRRRRLELRRKQEEPPSSYVGERDRAAALVVRAAVASLPRRQKTALLYRYFLDMSVEDTARQMECSRQVVKKLTGQAIARLREQVPSTGWWEEVNDGS